MKLLRLAKLGHRNITHHKKQTVLTVIVIGSLFGVLIATQMIIQGVEDLMLRQNRQLFSGGVRMLVQGCSNSELKKQRREAEVECNAKRDLLDRQQCVDEKIDEPKPCKTDLKQIESFVNAHIGNYGGKIVGYMSYLYNDKGFAEVVPLDLIKHAIEVDLKNTPSDAIPVIVSFDKAGELLGDKLSKTKKFTDQKAYTQDVRRESLKKVFDYNGRRVFIAGIVPYGNDALKVAKSQIDFQPIDLTLNGIQTNSIGMLYVDDGSLSIKELISSSQLKEYTALVEFSDIKQAFEFYKETTLKFQEEGIYSVQEQDEPDVVTGEFMTNNLRSLWNIMRLRKAVAMFSYVLLVVAIVIIVFTFTKIISQDDKIIALYRSLGAMSMDVFRIYLWYLIELCLWTAVYAFMLGGILATAVSYYYANDLNSAMSLFYAREINDFQLLVGLSQEIWQILGLIFCSAVVSSILTINQLSSKNVAKRLKQ